MKFKKYTTTAVLFHPHISEIPIKVNVLMKDAAIARLPIRPIQNGDSQSMSI